MITVTPDVFRLAQVFTISRGSRTEARVLTVRVTRGGVTGWGECVPYARALSGVQIWGDAVTWWAQAESKYVRSGRPAEGSVLVLRGWNDERRGHVAVVKVILSERMIRVDHANWMHKGEVSINVPVVDVSPANDWSQVRVWHVPGNYWGGRTYEAQGFIHPYRLNGSAGLSG